MFIDSHTHLDLIYSEHPERIEWFKTNGCIPISWSFGLNIESKNDLKNYLKKQSDTIHNLNRQGLQCYFLSGIHPRNITPDLKPDDIEKLLTPFLEDSMCLGLGEIGLETGDDREKEVLSAQLDLGDQIKSLEKKIGIHTPRSNKSVITQQILTLMDDFPDITNITVIDHCSPETIGDIIGKGYHAGVTISPVKASLTELKQMTQNCSKSIEKIMCNTDSGTSFYETLYEFVLSKEFTDDIKEMLAYKNANNFFIN